MQAKDYTLSVIVKERPIDEYLHDGRYFVEGRKGSEFELLFRNSSKGRVLVVPSIDGLSPFTGEVADQDSKGFIVAAGASLTIPGWTINDAAVARFLFENKDKSYGAHTEAGTTNAGVVGVLVYAEKVEDKPKEIHHHRTITPIVTPVMPSPIWPQYPYNGQPWLETQRIGSPTCAAGKAMPLTASAVRSMRESYGMGQMSAGLESSTSTACNSMAASRGVTTSDTLARYGAKGEALSKEEYEGNDESPFGIGTGWGSKADFKINHTTFNRGDLQAQLVIYYDTRRNLEKRGIVITPMRQSYTEDLPQAFAGVGCKPPPGWTG